MHNKLFKDTRFSFAKSSISKERSSFDLSHGHKFTMNAGKLVPFFIEEVLPGDTFQFNDAFVCRTSSPPVAPVMDTSILDQWLFYVPWRLVWDHTKEFFGENRESAWTDTNEYFIPKYSPAGGLSLGKVGDGFGLPPRVASNFNALPFRAYRLIWNEWFRDQNTQDPVLIDFGDSMETSSSFEDLLPVNKRKDYFTTALPSPQKGPDVLLPLMGFAPVISRNPDHNVSSTADVHISFPYGNLPNSSIPLFADLYSENSGTLTGDNSGSSSDRDLYPIYFQNLYADFSNSLGQATINQLRQAFAVQSLYELDARGGSRYREFLRAHFGTSVPDLTVQVPEFLAGMSNPINVSQVVQTSATMPDTDYTPQGNVAAISKTTGRNSASFTKSFSEPGYIIGVCAIRTLQTYQQGIPRMWSRNSRLDVYHPVLGHIGEQPIFNKEIYADGSATDNEVFGYQEPWAEYRYRQNYVSGYFRSDAPGSLDYWHYANDFSSLPLLSDGFIRETDQNIARTLSVMDTTNMHQFILDFWFNVTGTRVMSAYGTPAMLGRQ